MYKIYLVGGQSNTQGGFGPPHHDDVSLESVNAQGRIHQVVMAEDRSLLPQIVPSYKSPLDFNANPQGPTTGSIGFGPVVAASYGRDHLGINDKVLILPVGRKGTSITDYDQVGDNKWLDRMFDYLDYALQFPGAEVIGMGFQHGEADVSKLIAGDDPDIVSNMDYIVRFLDLVDSLHAQVGYRFPVTYGEPAPIWNQFAPERMSLMNDMASLNRPWMRFVHSAGLLTNAQYIDNYGDAGFPEGQTDDYTHYCAKSQIHLGLRHYEALKKLL